MSLSPTSFPESRQLRRQLADRWAGGRDDDLGAHVERIPRVIERVDRRLGVKVQIAPPIDAHQHVPQKRRDIMNIKLLIIESIDDQQTGLTRFSK